MNARISQQSSPGSPQKTSDPLGYPAYCNYIATDNNALLFRRFGALNSRVLLSLQHDIEVQEQHLKDLDERCAGDTNTSAQLNSLSWDKDPQNPYPERAAVLDRLQPLLQRYNEHLASFSALRERVSARPVQVSNLKSWLRDNSNDDAPNIGPIRNEEQQYLDAGLDLICITSHYSQPFTRFLESFAAVRWLCRKPLPLLPCANYKTSYHSDRRVEWLSNTITVLLGLFMLYGPMWWLNFVVDDAKRLAIITVFMFIFAIALAAVGSGRPFETLAATAAYAAVLMVFMQRQSD